MNPGGPSLTINHAQEQLRQHEPLHFALASAGLGWTACPPLSVQHSGAAVDLAIVDAS